MDAAGAWALFDEIAAVVRRTVLESDRVERGDRPGQYRLDVHADEVVVGRLVGAGFGVTSEESGAHEPDRAVCVVVDPVDGSTNASRGLPCWATSFCAVDAQGPWVSTVVDHSNDVTYRAERGGGATRQVGVGPWAPIAVAAPVVSADAIVALNGWSPERPTTWQYRALGAAAVELCLVADGSLDGYVNLVDDSHGPWDYLGALLVLREAGGEAVDRAGRKLESIDHDARRTIVAASGPALLGEMMRT